MSLELLRHHDFVLKLGSGGGSETFTAPTLFRSRSFQHTTNTSEAFPVSDTTPETPGYRLMNITGFMASISGTGLLNMNDEDVWRTWFMSGQDKNCQLLFAKPLAANGGHFVGPFLYTSSTYNADRDSEAGRVLLEVELQSSGDLVWVPASA